MKLNDILRTAGYASMLSESDTEITSITNDSREVKPGSLFVAVRGYRSDGHDYVKKAIEAGAAAVVAERTLFGIPVFVNPEGDNRKFLAETSAAFYRYPWMDMKTVGITGTNGKTSTAHMLRWILEQNGISTGVMGTVGHIAGGKEIPASVTTPESVHIAQYMRQMADSGDKVCVMEVSSHAIALKRVSSVRFDAAVFTNISQDHLDFHLDMNEYLNTKLEIFNLLKDKGTGLAGSYASGIPAVQGVRTFGTGNSDCYRISDEKVFITGSEYTLHLNSEEIPVKVAAPGRFNVFNSAGALAAAVELGVSPPAAAAALETFTGVPGRMEAVNCGQDFLVAVDYAHTPDALERVLEQGKQLAEGKLIAVFGCGGDRDRKKRPVMGHIASETADLAVVTSDNPRTEDPDRIIQDIMEGINRKNGIVVQPDRSLAIRYAINHAMTGDVVIIAGKGHEDYQILGTVKVHFDDREKAVEALKNRGCR
ncbi:UDP-N-acetylmuramoyl-L-alanyl-D-glutamate--2,6-diaminopimelate ligase [Candidatus Fermentibacteria bacterium]|nr:MAG: UDP-N-acetylmuramoyl-L-alanyl-D-glutamate--2,6-diaminopimelate ligase [Candidatus Fermentibacteria bacterium]